MVSSLKYKDTHILICILSLLWSSVLFISKRKVTKKRKKHIINLMIALFTVSGIISITELCNQYNYYARFTEFISFTAGFAILVISLYYYGVKLIISNESRVVSESSIQAQNPVCDTFTIGEETDKETDEETDEENITDVIVHVKTDSSSII